MSSIYDNYPAVRYVDEYDKDTDEQCVRCKGNCGFIGITGMWACKGFVPMTNADRIRGMSDEELAHFMTPENYKFPCPQNHNDCQYELIPCWMCWARWLKAPVEEATE